MNARLNLLASLALLLVAGCNKLPSPISDAEAAPLAAGTKQHLAAAAPHKLGALASDGGAPLPSGLMFAINPPAHPVYVPSTQPVAFVELQNLSVFQSPQGVRVNPVIQLLEANGTPVLVDKTQIPAITMAQQAAFLASVPTSGSTFESARLQALSPYLLAAYGLSGTIQ